MTKEFVQRVMQMRNAQKSYFRTKDAVYLWESKRLEQEVDKMIEGFTK